VPDVALAWKPPCISESLQQQTRCWRSGLNNGQLRPNTFAEVGRHGETLATTIMLETDDHALPAGTSAPRRCVDSRREQWQEEGRRQRRTATSTSPGLVRSTALRYCPGAKRFYERKKRKTNGIVAIKATAHKLARACYHMLREQKPFDVQRCFV
jgi:transposase